MLDTGIESLMGGSEFPEGGSQNSFGEAPWSHKDISLNSSCLASSIQSVKRLDIVSRRPIRLCNKSVIAHCLKTISSCPHGKDIAKRNPTVRVGLKKADEPFFLDGRC